MSRKAMYPREYLWFVDRVLREHPVDLDRLEDLERTIEAFNRPSSIPDIDAPASELTPPERITEAKLKNERYQCLMWRVERVKAGLAALNEKELKIVDMVWDGARDWEIAEELDTNERQVRRIKNGILRKMAPFVLGKWAKK